MLDTLVPRFTVGVTFQGRDDGTAVLAAPSAGRYLEVAADEARLAALIDGRRDITAVVGAHFATHGAISFKALGDLLTQLRRAGLLANAAAELDEAGIVEQPESFFQRRRHWLLGRMSGALARSLPLVGAPLGLLACLVGLASAAVGTEHRPLDPLLPGGSAISGLAGILVGAWLALTLRTFVRAFVGHLLGAKTTAIEARAYFGLPIIGVAWGQVLLLPRARRITVWLAALGAPWLLAVSAAALAATGRAGPALSSLALGAAIVGFLDAMPLAPGSLGHILAALARRVDLRDHARAYASRRLVSRLGSKGFFDGEHMLLLSSSLSIVWGVLAIRITSRLGAPHIARLLRHAVRAEPAEALVSRILAVVLLILVLGAFAQLAWILYLAVQSSFPSLFRARSRAGATVKVDAVDAAEGLHRVPIFSGLPASVLAEVAREVVIQSFKPGALIIREGDPGDRFYAVETGFVEVVHELPSGLRRVIARLGDGDCFGEMALLHPGPRSATVRARGPVRVLSISRVGFERLVQALPGVDLTKALRATAALRHSALAASIPSERITEMVPRLVVRELAPGEVIFRAGDAGDFFYLIDSGEVEILGPEGARAALLGSGESFGETALLLETPRTATARVTQATTLWALSRVDLYAVLSRNAELSDALEERAEARVVAS
jgi:CRP-like cAMP-binding protein